MRRHIRDEKAKRSAPNRNKRTCSPTVFNPDPGSQREKGGLEREKAYSGGKKRTCSQAES